MIPDFVELGSPTPWAVLPPGIHDATLQEIADRFATTPHRRWLYDGFRRMAEALAAAHCTTLYLDGSFTTAKPHPEDYDGCWDWQGVDFGQLDPVLLRFEDKRAAQKRKFLGEMFLTSTENLPGQTFLDFFQVDKFSGRPKGIVRVTLASPKGAAA
ncbi:MAG: hypothetical protein JWL96_1699 [Sphingomonas bacterium]|uniref:DUF6932 family protein n=1 Tax=Sphingomonas bacterium TaxID=1895847 RepID=UPI00262C919D|nr:hypothetical protein [Sphingomonas bacterium]MDB5709629.1 hypothetical protein [Sphingomonas bacterium]